MFDLTQIPDEVIVARGQFATVRGAHDDRKVEMQQSCGELMSAANRILKAVTEKEEVDSEHVKQLFSEARSWLADMELKATSIESLAKQRAELKPLAWSAPIKAR